MQPSPYFKDQFRYFFKRFYSEEKLFKWFASQTGEDTGSIDFPDCLKDHPKTLVFLPRDMKHASTFLKSIPQSFFENVLLFSHESLHSLVSARRAKSIYYSDTECRYGEVVFETLLQKILDFAPQVVIYLGESFLPRLYLAKMSGAPCRIGFCSESNYPFLNMSLRPNTSSETDMISNCYGLK
ncbi:MAG: hypothetical protein HUK20_14155 [Fibrobacter sp.]|nr:hypothetical protein [Fibrobacter sp.]